MYYRIPFPNLRGHAARAEAAGNLRCIINKRVDIFLISISENQFMIEVSIFGFKYPFNFFLQFQLN